MKKLLMLITAVFFLTACGKYNIKVDLTPEEKQAVKQEINQLKESIANYVPEGAEIDWRNIIDLANDYEKIGEIDKAIKIYKDVLDAGKSSKVIMNNLGRLYETAGEYDLAIGLYQNIVDQYADETYLYDITWAYIRAAQAEKGDEAVFYRKEAEKAFNAWQMTFKKTDEQTQDEIKKLREREKENADK